MLKRLLPLAALTASLLVPAAASAATPTVAREIPLGETPGQLTTDSAGNAWVVLTSGANDIVKVDPGGTVTPYTIANVSAANDITVGPDGNLWVSQIGGVARFAPADPTRAQAYGLSAGFQGRGIVTGPDENIWVVGEDEVFQIAPSTGRVIRRFTVPGMSARGLATAGGNLWIADFAGDRIVEMTTAGAQSFYSTGADSDPQEVAAGLNGQVGYTAAGLDPDGVGLITPPGPALGVPTPRTDAFGIAFGLDQAYWVANFAADNLTRLTSTGETTTLAGFSAGGGPRHIAASLQGTLWVGLETSRRIALVTGLEVPPVNPPVDPPTNPPVTPPVTPPVNPPVAPPPAGQQPVFTNVSLTRTTTVGRAATLKLNVVGAADVTIKVQQKASGRTSRGRCAAPSRSNRRGRACTRWVQRQSFTAPVRNGAVNAKLSARLAAGSYRVTVSATNATGTTTATRTLTVKPKPRARARRRVGRR